MCHVALSIKTFSLIRVCTAILSLSGTAVFAGASWTQPALLETTHDSSDSFIHRVYKIDGNYQANLILTLDFSPDTPIANSPYPGYTTYPHSLSAYTHYPPAGTVTVYGITVMKYTFGGVQYESFVESVSYSYSP